MKDRLQRAALVGLAIAAVLGLLHALGMGLLLLWMLAVAVGTVAIVVPRLGVRWLDELTLAIRAWLWRRESGHHHSFAGIALVIEEHAGQMWMSTESLQRALRQREDPSTTAARLAGHAMAHAMHNGAGVLMLNVQAVVHHLALMPRRTDPRVIRLRRYLERDVLYPASRRTGGGTPATTFFGDSGPDELLKPPLPPPLPPP